MRIRTVKPSFWPHPIMARLDDGARLLAVATLNLADDQGYLQADPALIRSAVWPFDDDSTKARRTLEQLSRAGWLELREHPERGLIARVATFTQHQRVDRPSPSKLKDFFDSATPRRTLDEDSTIARAGREGKGREERLSLVPSEQAHPSASPNGSVDNSESKIRKPAYPPDVDHDAVIAAFHELLPELPKVVSWTEKRRTMLRMRWRELAEKDRKQGRPWPDSAAGVARFRAFFTFVRDSKFLMGKAPPSNGRVFCATLEWLLNPSNFLKVIEGNYHAEG